MAAMEETIMAKRGELTPAIQAKAIDLFGREITIRELRLMPYVVYVMVNNRKIEPAKVNGEERSVLSQGRKEGYIEGGAIEWGTS